MKIYLIRHAEKETEGENPNLTSNGIKQAKLLAKRLKKKKFDLFYSSDMNRTRQTSEIVSKEIKMKPKIEDSLNEYEGSDIKNPLNKWKVEERKRFRRMTEFLGKLLKNPKKKKNILIIAHGITNRIIFSHLLNIPMNKTITFRQDETCVNLLKYSNKFENWRLVKMNDNHHVPERLR